MAKYVDGFVIPIPKNKLKAYEKLAKLGGKVWKDHGALEYFECVGDDMKTPMGLPFPKLTKLKPNETVVFSWIVFKSKAHRDKVNKKVMTDPRMTSMGGMEMPFNAKRMAYGGFEVLVDVEAKKKVTRKH